MNNSTKKSGIKLAIDWMKCVKMDIPYSRWVMFSLGVYVLAEAVNKLTEAIIKLHMVLQ